MKPITVIHVDIEGGWGGSARSLFELVSRLDRSKVRSVVVHREKGPLETWYASIGVVTVFVPEIGSYVPRQRGAFRNFVARVPQLMRLGTAAKRIADIAEAHDAGLIHLNYEGLFLLGCLIARRSPVPMVAHCRTMVGDNVWGRWLARSLSGTVKHLFCISENEMRRFERLRTGLARPSLRATRAKGCEIEVMPNIARSALPLQTARPPEIIYLGNISESKGVFRIPHIAKLLREKNAQPVRFLIYGKSRERAQEQRLAELCKDLEVSDFVELRGHSTEVSTILSSASLLVRLSLDNDPWGRDVIEATTAGIPVVATGTYGGVIEDNVNGKLIENYTHESFAEAVQSLLSDRNLWQRMSEAGQKIGRDRFGGTQQVQQFIAAVERITARCGASVKQTSPKIGRNPQQE